MADLDPETFEREKYRDHFTELQTAYKRAFDEVSEAHDSRLVHAIDQQVLSESEPSYAGDGEFTVDLPAAPLDRLEEVDEDRAERVLDAYVAAVEDHLRAVFDLENPEEPKA